MTFLRSPLSQLGVIRQLSCHPRPELGQPVCPPGDSAARQPAARQARELLAVITPDILHGENALTSGKPSDVDGRVRLSPGGRSNHRSPAPTSGGTGRPTATGPAPVVPQQFTDRAGESWGAELARRDQPEAHMTPGVKNALKCGHVRLIAGERGAAGAVMSADAPRQDRPW